ncbi:MAG: HIT family protein [Chlamydiota bacterium]|nr:HIT family protein [Chlamydiota bacterium]
MSGVLAAGSMYNLASSSHSEQVIEKDNRVCVSLPNKQLANKSLKVTSLEGKAYVNWTDTERRSAYQFLQKIVGVWKENKVAEQYLVYGKQEPGDQSFSWEVVPYYQSSNTIGRAWQQLSVLWRIIFGGTTRSESQMQQQSEEYQKIFTIFSSSLEEGAGVVGEDIRGNDAFCNAQVIDRQLVLEGREVNVLFNYAPIGFGGERLHFLIVPQKHKSKFSDLSESEYLEATKFAQNLMQHFTNARSIEDIYLLHKTGVDAGQTVPHWHLHLILSANKTQDFFGKLTVLKNMLIGSSPMKGEELTERVQSLKKELKHLDNKSN